jgi:hypothetical protein
MKKVTVFLAVAAMFLFSCGDNSVKVSGGTALDGTWLRSDYDGENYYQFKLDNNSWVYSEGSPDYMCKYSKGTWSSGSTISAPSSGTVTLTVTHIATDPCDELIIDFPAAYNSVKTNTATYDLNASGDVLTIRDAALTTGIWGTLEGTYQKQ